MYLFHCSGNNGFGAYLMSLQSAYVASVLTRRRLVVFCPFECEGNRVTTYIDRYFYVNHTQLKGPYESIHVETWPGFKSDNAYNDTHAQGQFVGTKSIVYFNTEHTAVDKIFKHAGLAKYSDNRRRVGNICIQILCFLQPKPRLTRLFEQLDLTTPIFVIHVRLGDSFMPHDATYRYRSHKTSYTTQQAMERIPRCFARFPNTSRVVVSDSKDVKAFCRAHGIVVTQYDPIHLGAQQLLNTSNVDTLFLDWFVMARSTLLAVARSKFSTSSIHNQSLVSCDEGTGNRSVKLHSMRMER